MQGLSLVPYYLSLALLSHYLPPLRPPAVLLLSPSLWPLLLAERSTSASGVGTVFVQQVAFKNPLIWSLTS